MQDPATFPAAVKEYPQQQRQQPRLRCPRCESMNTKFCYYNNYNLSQPRHFCKACRRYWTKGGALRNIPVGGGTRRNSKRSSSSSSNTDSNSDNNNNSKSISISNKDTGVMNHPPKRPTALQIPDPSSVYSDIGHLGHEIGVDGVGGNGGFSSLLEGNGDYGSLLNSFHHVGVGGDNNSSNNCLESSPAENLNFWSNGSGGGDSSGDGGGGEWPDLSIYTPRSGF